MTTKKKRKKDEIEVLAGGAPAAAEKEPRKRKATDRPAVDAPIGEAGGTVSADGPTQENDAPLFDNGPEIGCRVYREKGEVVVEFDQEVKQVEYDKRQCSNLCGHLSVERRELPVVARTGDEEPDEIDFGAELELRQGVVRITFPQKTKTWRMRKLACKLAIGEIRAKAGVLPSKSAG